MTDTSVSCLCGAVSLTMKEVPDDLFACHCGNCRKWTGSLFMGVFAGSDVAIQGEENILRYPSSDVAERASCKICGSPLFMHGLQDGNYGVPAALFPNDQFSEVKNEYFMKSKPAYYCLDSTGKKFDTY